MASNVNKHQKLATLCLSILDTDCEHYRPWLPPPKGVLALLHAHIKRGGYTYSMVCKICTVVSKQPWIGKTTTCNINFCLCATSLIPPQHHVRSKIEKYCQKDSARQWLPKQCGSGNSWTFKHLLWLCDNIWRVSGTTNPSWAEVDQIDLHLHVLFLCRFSVMRVLPLTMDHTHWMPTCKNLGN